MDEHNYFSHPQFRAPPALPGPHSSVVPIHTGTLIDPRQHPTAFHTQAPVSPWQPSPPSLFANSPKPLFEPSGHHQHPQYIQPQSHYPPPVRQMPPRPPSLPASPLMRPSRPIGFHPPFLAGGQRPIGLQNVTQYSRVGVFNTGPGAVVNLPNGEVDPFIVDWLKLVGAKRSKVTEEQMPVKNIKIPEARSLLSRMSSLLGTLRSLHGRLSTLAEDDTETWDTCWKQVQEYKSELLSIRSQLDRPGLVDHLVKKVENTRLKRLRSKRAKSAKEAEKNEKMLVAEQITDSWLQEKRQEELRLKTEESVQKSAKRVLEEVKKKQNEIKHFQSLLTAINKLREHRKEMRKKGEVLPLDTEGVYTTKFHSLEVLLSDQRRVYDEEEHALRVLMKEEVREKMSLQQNKVLDGPTCSDDVSPELIDPSLSGLTPSIQDPLEPFRQYWLQAESIKDCTEAIRGSWSCYEHPDGSPLISVQDTLPPSQCATVWEKFLGAYTQ